MTRYGYDALGRLASVTGPDGAVTFVLCDGGAVTSHEYGPFDKPVAVSWPDGPGRPPTSLDKIDQVLNTGTAIRCDPIRDTIQVPAPGIPEKPFTVVNSTGRNIT